MLLKETEPPLMKIPRVCLIRDMKGLFLGVYINGSCAVAAAKKVAPLIASKRVNQIYCIVLIHCLTFLFQTANNITKWNQVQEVLSTGHPTSSTPEVSDTVVFLMVINFEFRLPRPQRVHHRKQNEHPLPVFFPKRWNSSSLT
jgi:hypothetical protein